MKTQIIVALDIPSAAEIPAVVKRLPPTLAWYKVGLELFIASGPSSLNYLRGAHKNIFLDLKLHDIPRTVARSVSSAVKLGVSMLTVHASGGKAMLKAAADTAHDAGPAAPKVVAVTMLTSLDVTDLKDIGINRTPTDHVIALAEMAIAAGADGLVCSPQEVGELRRRLGPGPLLVTPGVRPAGGDVGDQKRVATPAAAVRSGATHLVIGRPILEAPDPAAAARAIQAEMDAAAS